MKWTIYELIKQEKIDNKIDEILDLSEYIEGTDIIRISPVHVSGDFEIYDSEEFVFYLDISCTLYLPDARTLEEIPFSIDLSVEEGFSTVEDEENHKIEGITIDLLPIIWSNIILEKPIRIVKDEDADFDLGNTEFETDDVNPAFANLKNNKK
jgi:uncharacterized protein